ncbi:Myb-like DNA-binding domain containing protein [Histomonas meleagridis]|nr:Myb-like DNA-binding domain containing protein [Histomonas meleagridis]
MFLGLNDDSTDFNPDFGQPRNGNDFFSDQEYPPSPSVQTPPYPTLTAVSPGAQINNEPHRHVVHQIQSKKTKWTPEEDDLLRKSVEIHGNKNWTAVSTLVPGRNPKQCRERWTAQLDPNLTKDNWTVQEDTTLLHIHKLHGNSWTRIASFLPGRSPTSVKNRFNWLSRRNLPQQMEAAMQFNPQQPQCFNPIAPRPAAQPWFNSFSSAQVKSFGSFSDSPTDLAPEPLSRSLSNSYFDELQWDEGIGYSNTQTSIEDLCGDFNWF